MEEDHQVVPVRSHQGLPPEELLLPPYLKGF